MPDAPDLRAAIVAALTAAAYHCGGDCGMPEHECFNSHPITWSGMVAGHTHLTGGAADIADIALAAIQGAYVPPPPGSDRAALPGHILDLISAEVRPYLSTACEVAQALERQALERPNVELLEWATRMHAQCRITHKYTMQPCACGCGHPGRASSEEQP